MVMTRTRPAPAAQGAAPDAPLLQFTNGAVHHSEGPFFDRTYTLGAASVPVDFVDVPAIPGYLRALWVDVQLISTGNSAAVTAAADAPWSSIADITFQDTSSNPAIGQLRGYNAYIAHKYFGYRGQSDPKLLPTYSAITTGAGATAGSGRFQLRLNPEINARDGFGSLFNGNNSTPYRIRMNLAPLAAIYGVAPNGTVTARVRVSGDFWLRPPAVDAGNRGVMQAPPAAGTVQYVTQQISQQYAVGQQQFRHTRVGMFIRNIAYVCRDNTGARAAAAVPADLQLAFDTRPIVQGNTDQLRAMMFESAGLITPTAEAAGGVDNGVIILPQFACDLNGRSGYETRAQYFPTGSGSRLETIFTAPVAMSLDVITNDIAPASGVML